MTINSLKLFDKTAQVYKVFLNVAAIFIWLKYPLFLEPNNHVAYLELPVFLKLPDFARTAGQPI